MNETEESIHWSFWVIGVVALIWNALGSVNFFVQMDPDVISAYRESERAIIVGRPLWATTGFATAVLGGLAGSILLLLRRSVAMYLFVASLAGVIITMIHALGAQIDFGPGEIVGIILLPLALAAFLIWYSKYSTGRGWIR